MQGKAKARTNNSTSIFLQYLEIGWMYSCHKIILKLIIIEKVVRENPTKIMKPYRIRMLLRQSAGINRKLAF